MLVDRVLQKNRVFQVWAWVVSYTRLCLQGNTRVRLLCLRLRMCSKDHYICKLLLHHGHRKQKADSLGRTQKRKNPNRFVFLEILPALDNTAQCGLVQGQWGEVDPPKERSLFYFAQLRAQYGQLRARKAQYQKSDRKNSEDVRPP